MSAKPSTAPGTLRDWQSDAPPATPFWQRVPKFFLLPLDKAVLTRILLLGAGAVISPLALALGFAGLLLMSFTLLVLLVWGASYGFTIIDRSSQGFLQPSQYPAYDENASVARPFKYVAINFIFVFVMGFILAITQSEFLMWVTWFLLFGIALPAVVMRLVMTGDLLAALSPAGVLNVAGRIGKPYLGLCVFVFFADLCRTYGVGLAGAGVGTAAAAAAGGGTPTLGFGVFALLFLVVVVFWYFTYMTCALIGYVMYQYADALEITLVGPGEARGPATRRVDVKARARDAMVGKYVAAGEIKDAIDVINDDLRNRPSDLSLHGRLHKLLLLEGYRPRIEDHTEKYLDLLMKTDNAREALPLAEEAFGRDANWEPRTLEHIAPLARAALAAGKPQLAAQLIRGFDKKHRMHPDTPNVYLVGAQLMLQQGGSVSEQARQILQHLVHKYPAHPAGQEGRRMLERLDHLAGGPPTMPR